MEDNHRPVARRTDPGTSWDAADSVINITQTRAAILRVLRNHGPMSDEDIAEKIGAEYTTPSGLRTRRRELVDAGLVIDTGRKVRLETGRHAIVWGIPSGDPVVIPVMPVPAAPIPEVARPKIYLCPDCNSPLSIKQPPIWGYVKGTCLTHGVCTVRA